MEGMGARAFTPRRRGSSEWDRAWRLPPEVWAVYLADPETVARYHEKIHKRAADVCWYYLGAISDTGHGKLRAGTRAAVGPVSKVLASHVFGYQLSRGPLERDADGRMPIVRHRCDETSCHNPACWALGTGADNAADYQARQHQGALTDSRGAQGRAVAIREAILRARRLGDDVEMAIKRASDAGMPHFQDVLF